MLTTYHRHLLSASGVALAALLLAPVAAGARVLHTHPAGGPPPPQFTIYTGGQTPGFAEGEQPFGVTAGPDGNIWFTAVGPTTGVLKVTPQGAVGTSSSSRPYAIVTGGDGNLWFTDTAKPAIGRITPSGMVTEFTSGLSAGDVPAGLTVDPDGSLYFVSSGQGPYVGHVDQFGTITEIAHLRSKVTADPSIADSAGTLYFTASNGRDEFLATVPQSGKPSLQRTGLKNALSPCCVYNTPQSIVTAADGSIWFTNLQYGDHKGNRPLGHLTAAGIHFYNAPIAWMGSLTPGPDNDMWIAGQDPFFAKATLGAVGPKGGTKGFTLPRAMSPFAIAEGPDGNLWMSATNGDTGIIIEATP
jgi:streptogramin lyase